ncbi:uncharacterized protein LOC133199631 [Saccostrea echinata]|uniref:uncharacterized protein LOC133199631 n=1 Tax=Saccostrea echinata TaxID=191078 RepID=UPI002A830450|nr:uncharacterized protein LOC133199631 [Saccostrea echinata]
MAGHFSTANFLVCVSVVVTKKTDTSISTIDFSGISYTFQCGFVECKGILQFCTEDETCGYCSRDLCLGRNPPDQCQIQCKLYQRQRGVTNASNILPRKEEDEHICIESSLLMFGGVAIAVTFVLLLIFLVYSRLNGNNATIFNTKNQFNLCCRCSFPPGNKYSTTCTNDREGVTSVFVPSGN